MASDLGSVGNIESDDACVPQGKNNENYSSMELHDISIPFDSSTNTLLNIATRLRHGLTFPLAHEGNHYKTKADSK